MKIISFYLPQFHTFPENDAWWGEGFTEWTSVKNAKPLFEGHNQPRVPYDDNYYNLTDKETLIWQSKLAEEYGIYGFCYYHYWFDGKMLMNKPMPFAAVAPPLFSGSVVFISMMVLGLGGMCASLSILAVKMKKKGTIVLFVLSFICAMGMGYMSSQDSTLAWVNWVEQSINTVSQLCLMLGTITLHKAGLAVYQFEEANA